MTHAQEEADFRNLMSGDPHRMLRAEILTQTELTAVVEMASRLGKIQSAALARLEKVRIIEG